MWELSALLKAIDIACQEVYDERLQWLLRWRLRLGPTDPDISYEIQEFGKAFAFGAVCTQPVADAFEEYIDHAIHGKEREWETRKREEIMRLMLDLELRKESPLNNERPNRSRCRQCHISRRLGFCFFFRGAVSRACFNSATAAAERLL
jgi:hypothetical protein